MDRRRAMMKHGEDITTGLYSHYKLLNLNDELGLNNLVMRNNPQQTVGVDGVVNSAYTSAINTNSYFNTAYNFYLTADFTVSIWIKISGTPSNYRLPFIFGSSTVNYIFGIEILSQSASQLPAEGADGPLLNDGLWHNLVYTVYIATGLTVKYLDGVYIGQKTQGKISTTALCRLGLLAAPNSAYNLMGSLDNVRYYTRILTLAQIKYIYDNKL